MSDKASAWEAYSISIERSTYLMDSIYNYQGSVNVITLAVLGWIITSDATRLYLGSSKNIRRLLLCSVPLFFLYVSVTLLQKAVVLEGIHDQMMLLGLNLFSAVADIDVNQMAGFIPSRLPWTAYLGYTTFNAIVFGILFCVIRSCEIEVEESEGHTSDSLDSNSR